MALEKTTVKYRETLLLLAISIILGGLYLLVIRPEMENRRKGAELEKHFFRADTRDILSIRVENKEGVVEISQGPQGWMIERPQRYRPDDGMIKKFLDTISGGRMIKVVGDANQLSQFGFDRPVLTLFMGSRNTKDLLVVGPKNPAGTGYYAFSEGLGKIFLINNELPEKLYLRLYDLREKRLYPQDMDKVGRIVISRGKETVELTYTGDGWQMISPVKTKASDEEVALFLKMLGEQKAQNFIPWEKRLDKLQRAHLMLLDHSGKKLVEDDVYYWGSGETEGIIVHSPGSTEATRTRRDFWNLLQTDMYRFLERHIFAFSLPAVTGVRVLTESEDVTIELSGNRWLKNGKKVSSSEVERLLNMLKNWKGEKRLELQPVSGKPHTTIEVHSGGSVQRLMVYPVDMTREVITPGSTIEVSPTTLERAAVYYWLASSTSLNANILVGSHEIDRFLGGMRNLK